MKSTLNRKTEQDFPKLMESIENNGFVVLFTSHCSGTVVATQIEREIGYHSEGWNFNTFKPYNGSIVIAS